jgi:hypothetical protein
MRANREWTLIDANKNLYSCQFAFIRGSFLFSLVAARRAVTFV